MEHELVKELPAEKGRVRIYRLKMSQEAREEQMKKIKDRARKLCLLKNK